MMHLFSKFIYKDRTIFLAINFMDYFLSRTKKYGDGQLELIAITAALLAIKTEEVRPIDAQTLLKSLDIYEIKA